MATRKSLPAAIAGQGDDQLTHNLPVAPNLLNQDKSPTAEPDAGFGHHLYRPPTRASFILAAALPLRPQSRGWGRPNGDKPIHLRYPAYGALAGRKRPQGVILHSAAADIARTTRGVS